MLIIVGLGNPTAEYADTYHNMGFKAIDALAASLNKSVKKAECNALTSTFSRNNEKIVLAKPMTYMNLSGEAVKSLLAKYKATPENLIVIYDDVDLERFTLRARAFGSAGTHNGMRNIVERLGTDRFKRIRVGIGRSGDELKDYVLSHIPAGEKEIFDRNFRLLAEYLTAYISDGDFDKLMREVNVVKG